MQLGANLPIPMSKIEIHDLDSGKPVNAAKSTAIFLRAVLTDGTVVLQEPVENICHAFGDVVFTD